MPWWLLAGAGLGLIKTIFDRKTYNSRKNLRADTQQYSPWTGMEAPPMPQAPNLMGNMIGLGLATHQIQKGIAEDNLGDKVGSIATGVGLATRPNLGINYPGELGITGSPTFNINNNGGSPWGVLEKDASGNIKLGQVAPSSSSGKRAPASAYNGTPNSGSGSYASNGNRPPGSTWAGPGQDLITVDPQDFRPPHYDYPQNYWYPSYPRWPV